MHPLQVLILRHKQDKDALVFEEACARAFEGASNASGYLATGEDLGVEIKRFDAAPAVLGTVDTLLNATSHTLVIVILDEGGVQDATFVDWLEQCWQIVRASGQRHQFLLFLQDERTGNKLRNAQPNFGTLQAITIQQLGERAIRPALISLRSLHEARVLLAQDLPGDGKHQPGWLMFFISHAKLDGLPLAHSLLHVLDSIPWLKDFYDARDLESEPDWQQALHEAAACSLLIILRTDAYEERPWCRQEALWAEEYGTPAILVEARPGLAYPSGDLQLDRMPSVRIPDGNLYRILHAAIRQGVRYLLFQQRVLQMKANGTFPAGAEVRAFSDAPSSAALLRVCRELLPLVAAPGSTAFVVYPDPPLRTGLFEAANALVTAISPAIRLVTPKTLATAGVL